MILEIENNYGRTIGALKVHENTPDGVFVEDTRGHITIADYDYDDIFDTNEEKVRVQLNEIPSTAFRSYNHESCVSPLEQELGAYKALLKAFAEKDYYDCSVLIMNYFGHIDYGVEFGYVKTHDEIVCILFQTLCSQLSYGRGERSFEDFCERMIKKIEGNLEK